MILLNSQALLQCKDLWKIQASKGLKLVRFEVNHTETKWDLGVFNLVDQPLLLIACTFIFCCDTSVNNWAEFSCI